MKTLNWKPITLLALIAITSGCGGSSTSKKAAVAGGASPTSPGSTDPNQWWLNPTPTPNANGNLSEAYTYSGTITGFPTTPTSTVGTFTLQSPPTDSKLKIRIQPTAGSFVSLPGYNNFSFSPQCAQYKITVNGQTIQTNPLRVAGTAGGTSCYGAADSQVVDFSGRIGSGGTVQIKVSEARYDVYCQMFMQCYYNPWTNSACSNILNAYTSMCPMKNVYQNHTVNFNLRVGTNHTQDP